MKTAYLDCFSGISGDMLVGALLDAGLELRALEEALDSLRLPGVRVEARREGRNHIHGTRFVVHVDEAVQAERSLRDIRRVIRESGLSERVKARSLDVFRALAEVEARIHDCEVENVHFHEVGAADSIVDIVAAVLGVEALGIERLVCSPLPLGSGFVKSRHGIIPVPAPAALALLRGVPVKDAGLEAETVTPTGAALARVLCDGFGSMPSLELEGMGYGVGSRDLPDRPNLLRIVLGEAAAEARSDMVVLLEATLDDNPPEWTGHLAEQLFEAGALDVWLVPVQMKKNRPGVLVQAVARPGDRDRLADVILRESTTLGVRFQLMERRVLERETAELESPWGLLEVKRARGTDGVWRILPEYEACRRVAREHGLALREVYGWVYGKAKEMRDERGEGKD
ncbi:MAG: nickel pincer cofactor biosynthesis protein LarC [Deltaproteobacteria bacterium]|nr:nickel pincer cofactor biosynthesis protein LarC [Deltaproteobacteria bacterium]